MEYCLQPLNYCNKEYNEQKKMSLMLSMHHVFIAIVICKGREDQHNHSEMWDASGVSVLEYCTEQKTKENECLLHISIHLKMLL